MNGYPQNIVSLINQSLDLDQARIITSELLNKGLLGPHHPQLCLTSRPDAIDPLYDGAGMSVHPERDFSVLNPLFEGSVFHSLLSEISEPYGRVRLMYLEPRKSYSIHRDVSRRIHYAIETNPQANLLVEMDRFRMWKLHIPADGRGYKVNTTLPHTAINGGEVARIHLLINLI